VQVIYVQPKGSKVWKLIDMKLMDYVY
jgi:hypothetical protein